MYSSDSVPPFPDRRRFLAGLAASVLLAGCSRPIAHSTVPADPRVSYYTCAMHPSVRSDDPEGKCPICGMGLVPVYKDKGAAQEDAPTQAFSLPPDQARLLGLASTPLSLREIVRTLRAPARATATNAATASFFEGDAVLLAPEQAAAMTFDALPGTAFPGRIAALASRADPITHRLDARITLATADPRLRPGFAAVAEVSIPQGKRLVAPLEAVLPTGKRHVILVDLGNNRIDPRYVEVGLALPDGWEILSGVTEGERLVISANYLVEAQARIEGNLKGWGQ